MQTNVTKLQAMFPNSIVKTVGVQAKVTVPDLLDKHFDQLAELRQAGNNVLGKRSGKAITIIVSPIVVK